jgi:hypothetical protein
MFVRARRQGVTLSIAVFAVVGLATGPCGAVNTDLGNTTVSATPASFTPHVMDGSVNAITQVGNMIIAGGTFTSVSPSGTYANTADDVTRNGLFAFNATTGAIDPSFNPNLDGNVNSLDTDGTYIYAGGNFSSVGGSTATKRLVKLTSAGAVVTAFKAVPSAAVNEVVVRGSRLYIGGAFVSVKNGAVTTSRGAFAALDTTTGAVLPGVDLPFSGVYDPNNAGGGGTNVKRFDVSPDGTKVAAIGNFASVGGLTRSQIAVLDVGGSTASTGRTTRAQASSTVSRATSTSPRTGPTSWCPRPVRSPVERGPGRCATASRAGRPTARARAPRGRTSPAVTRPTAWR